MNEIQETVFEHISGSNTVTVTAAERWAIALIKKLKEQNPEQVEIVHVNADGSLLAHVPFEWMTLKPKRRMSEQSLKNLKSNR